MSTLSVVTRNIVIFIFIASGLINFASAEILPSSSAVLIKSGSQESTIDIKNNGNKSVLLYSKISRLPDDNLAGGTLYTEPQAIVMAPGDTQTIRVIYRTNTPDAVEHIARVIFTGLPPQDEVSEGKVKILVGQDLPVVINVRKDLKQKDVWEQIKYRTEANRLCMYNPTAKVFRFSPNLKTDEKNIQITFRKPYVLPGEELCAETTHSLAHGMHLNITSVSDYNYLLKTNKVIL
ncbi:fimbria/pilus periplasmic chaperone [Erwinia papayae]|uniref:Fimbria/pilus periplasmic chaperone n=1 Tax=Erwinia papayae TaxID=206499 RepID=A0ABV3N213_9GAMM